MVQQGVSARALQSSCLFPLSLPRFRAPVVIGVAFLVSRVAYYAAGVHFDTAQLTKAWQFIEPDLLKTDLWRSLFYLHSQPPLYNLFLGVVLNLFVGNEARAFYIIYLVSGIVLAFALYGTLRVLRVSEFIALPATLLFVISPAAVLYENWLTYTYPTAVLLCLAASCLALYTRQGQARYGAAFFGLVAAIILTRSVYHIVWFVAVVALLLICRRQAWRTTLRAAAIPFVLVLALFVKNWSVFGEFSSSSWFGMNLARISSQRLSYPEREQLVLSGKMSAVSLVAPFSTVAEYRDFAPTRPLVANVPTKGVPVLDREGKAESGINLNNFAYISLSKAYLADGLRVILLRLDVYIQKGLQRSTFIFFLPASNFTSLPNRKAIADWDTLYNTVVDGQFEHVTKGLYPNADKPLNLSLWVIACWAATLIYGCVLAWRVLRRKGSDPAAVVPFLFMWLTILYVSVVGNMFDIGENNRFRFEIDPLLVICGAILLQQAVHCLRPFFNRKRAVSP